MKGLFNFCQMERLQNKGWFGLWCLTPLSNFFQLYQGGQYYWLTKAEYPEKITGLQLFIDKRLWRKQNNKYLYLLLWVNLLMISFHLVFIVF
jgi:hypothetical protein